MTGNTRHRSRSIAGDMEDLYVFWVHGLPHTIGQPKRWQDLKDIIRDYCGHVHKTDTIPPAHDIGYATIPGRENADVCLSNFQRQGWNGARVTVALSGPLRQKRTVTADDYECLPRIAPVQDVPLLPPPQAGMLRRHAVQREMPRPASGYANIVSPYVGGYRPARGPLSPTRETFTVPPSNVRMPPNSFYKRSDTVSRHNPGSRHFVSANSGYKDQPERQAYHQTGPINPSSRHHASSSSSRHQPSVAVLRRAPNAQHTATSRRFRESIASSSATQTTKGGPVRNGGTTEEQKRPTKGPLVVDGAESSCQITRTRRRHSPVDSDSSEEDTDTETYTGTSSGSSNGRDMAAITEKTAELRLQR